MGIAKTLRRYQYIPTLYYMLFDVSGTPQLIFKFPLMNVRRLKRVVRIWSGVAESVYMGIVESKLGIRDYYLSAGTTNRKGPMRNLCEITSKNLAPLVPDV